MRVLPSLAGLFALACTAREPTIRGGPADPSVASSPPTGGSGVLRGGLEVDALAPRPASDDGPVVYACPHHPEVRQAEPGTCPKCKMDLVPSGGGASTSEPPRVHDHAEHGHGAEAPAPPSGGAK